VTDPGGGATVVVDTEVVGDDVAVDADRWGALMAAVLAEEGVAAGARATLHFVTDEAMVELNREHMGQDRPTDVLAFPIDGLDAVGAADAGEAGPPALVGDVVVCPTVAAEQAAGHAGTVDDEIALLVVHGALHLVGHDHAEADERTAMQARERALLAAHHGPLAGDPWADGAPAS